MSNILNINNKVKPLSEGERTRKEFEFDMRLRTILMEMQRTFNKSAGACLSESLQRLTKNEIFTAEKPE